MIRLPPLDPAVAETRVAVRRSLGDAVPRVDSEPSPETPSESVATGLENRAPLVLIALSGGADSLALAAAAAFEAPRRGLRAGAAIVDHGLQAGSGQVAARAAAQAAALGLAPVLVRRAEVDGDAGDGPEAAARAARYRELEACRLDIGAVVVLTAHTRDDQAEQVLLALARGSGVRALAGIPPQRGAIRRPFLGLSRETTERACAVQGLEPWRDPHNADAAYARVRVRERILPALERELGPGIAASLARTAALAREDADALDALAADALDALLATAAAASPGQEPASALPASGLEALPAALRGRVIRAFAQRRLGTALSREHTLAVAALATDWRGQGPIDVPGGRVRRSGARLIFEPR